MREFWVRLVSAIAVVGLIFGYNSVLDTRAKDDQIAKLNAKITDEKSGDSEESSDGAYKNGTYTGEAQGFGGPVDVEVIVENGMISEINITSAEKEDGAYLSMAEDIIPSILEAQSAEVDTISGATFSSTGIKEAVAQALEEAANQED